MAVVWAINCRAAGSAPFQGIDVAPEVLEDGLIGWSPAISGSADRDAGVDRRLAGVVYRGNSISSAVKDFTIPSAGAYLLRLALGDASFAQSTQYVQIFDTTTLLVTVDLVSGTASGSFADATGVERTAAAWPGSNAAASVTFATTTLRVALGNPGFGGGSSTLAHLSLESTGAAPAGGAFHQTILSPRRWRRWR